MTWQLEAFERLAYARDREGAARMLFGLLQEIDGAYGDLGQKFSARLADGLRTEDIYPHMLVRLCAAISSLLSDPAFQFSPEGVSQILVWHRWLATIFSATDFINADHVLRSLNLHAAESEGFAVSAQQLDKFAILYSPDSNLALDMDALHAKNPLLAVGLGLVLMSPRFLGSRAAHAKRETLLGWLPAKLEALDGVEQLPMAILHDVYMHCSYADRPDRHAIKRTINQLIRRTMQRHGLAPAPRRAHVVKGRKPVMLVVLEWFSRGHSIYRTHSRTLEAARELFTVVAMAYPNTIDEVGRAVFDEVIDIDPRQPLLDQVATIATTAAARDAQVLYMPSVGMFPLTMFLANTRVAPLQAMALGHPATTHSSDIDCVIVEDDYVGEAACFSEPLLRLPADGMPYRPSQLMESIEPQYKAKGADEPVEIIVAATTMKLNPNFLQACAAIAQRASRPVRFHFLVGQALGLVYPAVRRLVQEYLGDKATVYRHQPYPEYMRVIVGADMFLNPFPFGNTNGIIDTVSAGLVGVCKTGPEVFEHIDQGLFTRLGFPEWTIASTVEAYVDAAVRMIDDPAARMKMRRSLTGPKAVGKLFNGRPQLMGRMLLARLEQQVKAAARAEAPAAV